MKKLSFLVEKSRNYATRSGKKRRGIPKLSDPQPFFEQPKLPINKSIQIFEDMSNLVQNTTDKFLTTEDNLKKNFFILPYHSILVPKSNFACFYKNFTAKKDYTKKLQSFNLENSKIVDKRALYSVFVHNSCVDGELKNKTDIGHKRLAHMGENVLNMFISSYLYSHLEIDMKLKQSLLDITWDGTLNKASHKLGFAEHALIDPAFSKYFLEKFNVEILLAYIGLTYLDRGFKYTMNYIGTKIFPVIIECHKPKEVDYVKILEETFSEKFNVLPRYEIQFQNTKLIVLAVFAYDKYMGVDEGHTIDDAKQKLAKQVYNDLTKGDFAKDNYIYN